MRKQTRIKPLFIESQKTKEKLPSIINKVRNNIIKLKERVAALEKGSKDKTSKA